MQNLPFSTVIVGFDGSAQAEDALMLGRVLARAGDAQVVLAHVTELQPPFERQLREYLQAKHERVRGILDPGLAMLEGDVRADSTSIEARSPARGLYDLAASYEAPVLVVGSTHRGPVGRVMIGSVAEMLLSGAPCPVAVAPRGFASRTLEKIGSVGAGFDGSAQSRRSLKAADAVAAAVGATLHAIIVAGRHARTLEHALPELVAEDVTEVMLEGDPAKCLSDAGRDLDLLVVGTRGYGPLHHVLLGSVSAKLMRSAPCPLLVTPGATADGEGAAGPAGAEP